MSAITSITGLQNLTSLQRFYADYNFLSSPDLSGLTSLITADLSDCRIPGSNDRSLTSVNVTGCTSLEDLRLNSSNFSAGIPTLTSLTSLQQLYLNSCNLSGALDISSLTSLTNCDLNNNNLTSVELPLGNLSYVNLYDNALTSESIVNILTVLHASGIEYGYINLSGGTNATSNINIQPLKQFLNNKGWTVELNQAPPASVNIAPSTDFNIIGDFTIEMFVNLYNTNGFPRPYSFGAYPAPNAISFEGSQLYFWANGQALTSVTFNPSMGQWNHIAIVGRGSTLEIYINGSSVRTASYGGSISSQNLPLTIGNGNEPNSSFNGMISSFRWSNVARYSSPLFPPIMAPFTTDSSTVALLFQGTDLTAQLTDGSGNGHNAVNDGGTYMADGPFLQYGYQGSLKLGSI